MVCNENIHEFLTLKYFIYTLYNLENRGNITYNQKYEWMGRERQREGRRLVRIRSRKSWYQDEKKKNRQMASLKIMAVFKISIEILRKLLINMLYKKIILKCYVHFTQFLPMEIFWNYNIILCYWYHPPILSRFFPILFLHNNIYI